MILGDYFGVAAFMFFAGGMCMTHWNYLQQNLTTLDDLGGFMNDRNGNIGRIRAKYDFGVLYNLRCAGFLNPFWWLPLPHREKYEGCIWHELGKSKEYFGSSKENKVMVVKDGEYVEMSDAREVIETSQVVYKGFHMMYFEETVKV